MKPLIVKFAVAGGLGRIVPEEKIALCVFPESVRFADLSRGVLPGGLDPSDLFPDS